MRERRYAPLGATTALDTRVTALESGYLPLTGGTLTGSLIIDAENDTLTLKSDQVSGNTASQWLRYADSAGTSMGFVGFGSNSNTDFYIWNEAGGDIRFNTDLYIGDGANSLTLETSVGDAALYIKADTDNNNENDNPYIRMEQDGNGVQLILGITGADDIDPQGNTFTNSGNNGVALRQGYASGTINIGVGTSVGLKLASNNDVTIFNDLYPAGGQTTGRFVDMPSSSYGSVCVDGAEVQATWEGYSINGRAAFMWHPTEERGGIYDDVNNKWAVQWNPNNASGNEELWLYNGSVVAAKTKQYTATAQTSSLNIKDHAGTERPAGFNTMPRVVTNASVTLAAEHCGGYIYSNNSTTYTVTVTNGTDLPSDAVITIINFGSGNINVNQSSTTLYHLDGSLTSGNRVVGPYSVATLVRYGTTAWFLWGSSIT